MKTFSTAVFVIVMIYWSSAFGKNLTEIEVYLDEMLSFQLNFDEEKERLSGTIDVISEKLTQNPQDPYLWYLKGRSSLALVYVLSQQDSQYKAVRNRVATEYKKALKLNKEKPSLSSKVLSYIFTSPTVASVGVEATRQYIALEQIEDRLQKEEHLEVLRDRVVAGLIRQNKFEEALKELDYIDEHFPDNAEGETGNNVWRLYYAEEIEKQKAKLAAEKVTEEKPSQEESKPEKQSEAKVEEPEPETPTVVVPEPKLAATSSVPQLAESTQPTPDSKLMWYVLLIGVLVIAIVIAVRKKTRHR